MDNNEKVIDKENKTYGKRFVLFILAAGVVGGIIGIASRFFANGSIYAGIRNAYLVIRVVAAYITVPMVIAAAVITHFLYHKGKRLYENIEEDNEEQMNAIDATLGRGLALTSVTMIVGYFLFALGILGTMDRNPYEISTDTAMLMCFGGLILNIIYVVVYQRKIVDLIKKMNQEKHGSLYDPKFNEKWEASCDEAELAQIHEAGYYAFKKARLCCMILWLVCVNGIINFHFGIIPVSMVSIIWLVLTLSYFRKSL